MGRIIKFNRFPVISLDSEIGAISFCPFKHFIPIKTKANRKKNTRQKKIVVSKIAQFPHERHAKPVSVCEPSRY